MAESTTERLGAALVRLLTREGQPGKLPEMGRIAAEAGLDEHDARAIFPCEHALLRAVYTGAWLKLFDTATRAVVAVDIDDPARQLIVLGEAYLDWAFADPALFNIVNDRTRLDFSQETELQRFIDALRQLVTNLLERTKKIGHLAEDEDIQMLLLASRSYVYGLARMYSDGHFAEWLPDADPKALAKVTLRDYVERVIGENSALAMLKKQE